MGIHPTAIIDPKAELAHDVEVGAHCVIDAHVRVASGCRLRHNVYLTGWTQIEEDCEFHPGAIIGHDPQDTKYASERSYCRIGRGTIVREYATIHRGTTPESTTTVGQDCFLLGGAHVAHNCSVGDRVTLINDVLLGGYVTVGDGATVGGGAAIHQFVRIGELAMIAGCARVIQDVLPYAVTDVDGKIAGINRVGLRRAGMARGDVEDLRNAYRVLFERGLSFREAVEQLSQESRSPCAGRLLEFLQGESRRGLASRPRKTSKHQDVETSKRSNVERWNES